MWGLAVLWKIANPICAPVNEMWHCAPIASRFLCTKGVQCAHFLFTIAAALR